MEISLNAQAHTPFEMFHITDERSNFLLEHIAKICGAAYDGFPNEYGVLIEAEEADRLDVARMVTEMIAPAENEHEKNYILYVAHSGIGRVFDMLTRYGRL